MRFPREKLAVCSTPVTRHVEIIPQDKQKQPWTSENEMSSEIVASLLEREERECVSERERA